ncbi:hypothetical protein BJF79_16180 [Actinomadura sp. CNU-125]|nr:hypothetical protein BJF79_16180 [Actinomadura sp. CNU-125]
MGTNTRKAAIAPRHTAVMVRLLVSTRTTVPRLGLNRSADGRAAGAGPDGGAPSGPYGESAGKSAGESAGKSGENSAGGSAPYGTSGAGACGPYCGSSGRACSPCFPRAKREDCLGRLRVP